MSLGIQIDIYIGVFMKIKRMILSKRGENKISINKILALIRRMEEELNNNEMKGKYNIILKELIKKV